MPCLTMPPRTPTIMSFDGENGLDQSVASLTISDPGDRNASDLLGGCRLLVEELEQFQHHLVTQKQNQGVELRHFKSCVKTELKSLEKVS
jgi:hypothetical protein